MYRLIIRFELQYFATVILYQPPVESPANSEPAHSTATGSASSKPEQVLPLKTKAKIDGLTSSANERRGDERRAAQQANQTTSKRTATCFAWSIRCLRRRHRRYPPSWRPLPLAINLSMNGRTNGPTMTNPSASATEEPPSCRNIFERWSVNHHTQHRALEVVRKTTLQKTVIIGQQLQEENVYALWQDLLPSSIRAKTFKTSSIKLFL